MRRNSWMSDDCLQVLRLIIHAMEMASVLPLQLQVAQLELLTKPLGGWRPIGLFCPLGRSRGRCRRCCAPQWGVERPRPFYAGQAFASASDVVCRRSFRAESSISAGEVAGALLWDRTKFYEGTCLDRLAVHLADIDSLELSIGWQSRFICVRGLSVSRASRRGRSTP